LLKAPTPDDEKERLESLRSLGVLDTEPEERFDRFTRVARRIFGVPIALVSLVDENRQWFKSRQGLDATETPRDISFCGHAICRDDALVVSDTLTDERFADNPLVTENPNIRFYAGHPLVGPDGRKVGTLCLIDREPRAVDKEDLQMLADLAAMVEGELGALDMATIDELTQLSNRRGFRMVAEKALAVCQRLGRSATLLYFDLDGFKEINDEFGHAEGDRALVEVSDLLREGFRDSDVVARLGGDEFCILLSGTIESQNVATVLERLASKIEARNAEAGRAYALAYSVGQIAFDPERHDSVDALLHDADRLMYEDKRRRKSRDR
jgi:diguanylate cyclase (GGDEF)-like protein